VSTVESPGGLTLRVGSFEGPLDLLLHLARTQEIDLASLPIRTITDQYLAHLEAIEFRDLEMAGAYLVMAATLIYLKSKLLVPPDPAAEEQLDDEGEALRHELEERLREYARVKAAGAWLAEREAEQALLWGRPTSSLPRVDDIPLEDLSVHLLERTLRRLIEDQLRQRPREIEADPPSLLERMTEILSVLRDAWSLLFSSLVGNDRQRPEIVVSLLAVLELVRLGRIRAQQTELFGEIVIERGGVSPPANSELASALESPPREPGGLRGGVSPPANSELASALESPPREPGGLRGGASPLPHIKDSPNA
jgi:segregation and condensation protein A